MPPAPAEDRGGVDFEREGFDFDREGFDHNKEGFHFDRKGSNFDREGVDFVGRPTPVKDRESDVVPLSTECVTYRTSESGS